MASCSQEGAWQSGRAQSWRVCRLVAWLFVQSISLDWLSAVCLEEVSAQSHVRAFLMGEAVS